MAVSVRGLSREQYGCADRIDAAGEPDAPADQPVPGCIGRRRPFVHGPASAFAPRLPAVRIKPEALRRFWTGLSLVRPAVPGQRRRQLRAGGGAAFTITADRSSTGPILTAAGLFAGWLKWRDTSLRRGDVLAWAVDTIKELESLFLVCLLERRRQARRGGRRCEAYRHRLQHRRPGRARPTVLQEQARRRPWRPQATRLPRLPPRHPGSDRHGPSDRRGLAQRRTRSCSCATGAWPRTA